MRTRETITNVLHTGRFKASADSYITDRNTCSISADRCKSGRPLDLLQSRPEIWASLERGSNCIESSFKFESSFESIFYSTKFVLYSVEYRYSMISLPVSIVEYQHITEFPYIITITITIIITLHAS